MTNVCSKMSGVGQFLDKSYFLLKKSHHVSTRILLDV